MEVLAGINSAALLTLTGVIFTALLGGVVTITSSRRSAFITSVTAERIKWIAALRARIQEYINLTSRLNYIVDRLCKIKEDGNSDIENEFNQCNVELNSCTVSIFLLLSPENIVDKNLYAVITTADHYISGAAPKIEIKT